MGWNQKAVRSVDVPKLGPTDANLEWKFRNERA